jgi:hypothetical protein
MSSLINRIEAVEKKMNAGLQIARKQSKDAATEVATKLENQLEQRFGVLDQRVAELQSERQADGEQLAKLNAELKTLRSDVQNQIASVRENTLSEVRPELAELRTGIAHNGEGVATIANQLDRQRVEFEIPKNKSLEVSPGLYLSIENGDVDKQQIDGWLYVKDEHRTLWFHDQGVLKPITVYGSRDREMKEVVITRVTKNATVGYVLLPKPSTTAVAANQ